MSNSKLLMEISVNGGTTVVTATVAEVILELGATQE